MAQPKNLRNTNIVTRVCVLINVDYKPVVNLHHSEDKNSNLISNNIGSNITL